MSPSQAQLDALTLNLDTINARSNFVPVISMRASPTMASWFLSNGNSTYNGASAQLTRASLKARSLPPTR
jgi:hypothetical protein